MIFVSDLDKTLVFSGYPEHCCVEYHQGKEITYMTQKGYEILKGLISKPDFRFIPCTLRSIEQTLRIEFISPEQIPIIICDNGFSIYVNGKLERDWDKQMQQELSHYPNQETKRVIEEYITTNHIDISQVKSNRNAFYTVIFNDKVTAEANSQNITSFINPNLYKWDLQGRKLYIIPKFLDKSLAVQHLRELLPNEHILTAGDSSVDCQLVSVGDKSIIPAHATIQVPNALVTKATGIEAGEEILHQVKIWYEQRS